MNRIRKIEAVIYSITLFLALEGLVTCQNDLPTEMPKECRMSLGAKQGGSLSPTLFTSTSSLNENFTASNGRLDSLFAWIPSYQDMKTKGQQYLQVDLGQEMTVTAVKTQGYMTNYVKKFKLVLSLDGVVNNYYKDNHGDRVFESRNASSSIHFICPVVARYVRFVPVEFEKQIALRVDIFGCNKTFRVEVANISELVPVSVQQYQVTYSWTVTGDYDVQKVFYNKLGEAFLHKPIPKMATNTYVETIRNLQPCTKYKITVAVFKNCKSKKKYLFVKTIPMLPETPLIVNATSPGPFTANIKWKMPIKSVGCYANVTGFYVAYNPSMQIGSYAIRRIESHLNHLSITGLMPWMKYQIKLYAESAVGRSSAAYVEVDVNGKAPEKPVDVTYLQSETATSFTVKWDNPSPETVNGAIKGYAIFYRRKSDKYWNSSYPSSLLTSATIDSLSTGSTYQVYVVLFNNLYNISTAIKEVDVTRRDPMLSPELTKSLTLIPDLGQLTVQWKIPESLKVDNSDIAVVDVRKLGDKTWMQRNVTNLETTNNATFEGLQEWRAYEAKIKLFTKPRIYFTNSSVALVNGRDQKSVVKISSLTSTSIGSVQLSLKIPKQYISSNLLVQTKIRWLMDGSSSLENINVKPTARLSTHSINRLRPWNIYGFEVGIALFISRGSIPVFTSRVSRVMVVGDSPGKPPASVSAVALGPNSISVSWQPIPSQFVNGYISGYTVFLSFENATVPQIRHVNNSTRSVMFHNLLAETMYSLQVAGRNTTGYGPLSDVVMVRTAKEPRPPTPVLISAQTLSSTEILVVWKSLFEKSQGKQNFTVVVVDDMKGTKHFTNFYETGSEESKKEERQHSLSLKDLKPSTTYKISVFSTKRASGKLLKSFHSNLITATTNEVPKPPTPRLTSAKPVSSHEVVVTWVSLVDLTQKVENFTVVAVDKTGRKLSSFYFNMKSDGDKRKEKTYELKVKRLKPFAMYKIYVYASKLYDGTIIKSKSSNESEVETKEAAPTEPTNLVIKPMNGGYLLTWNEPAFKNGLIRKYILRVWIDGSKEDIVEEDISTAKNQYPVLSELKPYTKYRVSLKAVTIEAGPPAQLSFVTPEGYPGVPRDVKAVRNGTNIFITWKNPEEENGKILQYKIRCKVKKNGSKDPPSQLYYASAQDREFVLPNVEFGTKYSVKISAETSKGPGPDSPPASIYIEPKEIPKPKAPPQPSIVKNKISSTTMVVKLHPSVDKSVSIYQIIIEKLNSVGIQRRAVQSIPDMISNYKNASDNGDRFYIAAQFKPEKLPDEFIVGDGKTYSGYYNAPLSPQTVYRVHVRAGKQDRNGEMIYGESGSVRSPATAPRKTEKKSTSGIIPLPIIVGIAGALLLLVILVAIIIMYLRKSGSSRRQNGKQRKEPYDIELAHLRTKMDPGEQRPVSLTGDFPLHPDHPPISVSNYSKQIAKLHRSENTGFRAEYYQLEMGKEFSWDVAHLTENKPKNRFANIVAYDHARVILTRIPGIPGSDYINASYIDGFMKPNAYIATQGPLPGTFNDFWRMIWELRSSVIVMLTNLQEKNKLKCHKYWPDDCIEYGEVIVTLTRKEQYADYVIRTFILERPDSQETREVKHFHFTVWPDHGVPRYATAILAFRRRVRAYSPPESGPTIVHCSAGVGRTGTYITLDSMLDRIGIQGDVDIFNFIAAIRTRRIAMVQTEEQYIFIHDAILEANQCGNTEITAVDLRLMVNRLEKVSLETKMTGFEKEWKTLNNVSPIPPKSSCNMAMKPENMNKNRSQTVCVLPADNNLARLLTIEDDEATAYINAVYVDGYKQRNSFILTQSPLKNTVVDFWRMLCEHKSASVVFLCSLDEGDDFVKFWPDAHIREYEMISVECLSKTRGNDIGSGDTFRSTPKRGDNELIVRQFKVEDSRYPEFPLMIKLFQYVGWSETKVPSNCNSIIQLINQLERWQQQSGNGPITVVCSDGLGRSGTFASLAAVIERVKIEQVIDVFQAIKAMRIQRAHLVKTLEQYRFIYHAVEEYLTAFDDYANFK